MMNPYLLSFFIVIGTLSIVGFFILAISEEFPVPVRVVAGLLSLAVTVYGVGALVESRTNDPSNCARYEKRLVLVGKTVTEVTECVETFK